MTLKIKVTTQNDRTQEIMYTKYEGNGPDSFGKSSGNQLSAQMGEHTLKGDQGKNSVFSGVP